MLGANEIEVLVNSAVENLSILLDKLELIFKKFNAYVNKFKSFKLLMGWMPGG